MRRGILLVLVLIASSLASPAAAGAVPIWFSTYVPIDSPTPNHVVVGDFTRDGLPDVAVANGNTGIDLYPGTGAGFVGAPVLSQINDGPTALAAGDMDRDGGLDLVVTTSMGDVVVMKGYSDGSFTQISRTTVGDANRDGKLDVAVTSSLTDSVGVLLGDGAGGFTGGRFYGTASQPIGVVLTDLTRDGKPDLAYACVAGGSVSVRAGDGTGRFGAALTVGSLADPDALVAGDVDRDGAPELVVAEQTSGEIAVLERLTSPSEQWVVDGEYAAGTGPRDVVLADFDRDGDLDAVAATDYVVGATLLTGDGDGGFAAPSPASGLAYGACLTTGDLDRDGRIDIVLGNRPPSGPATAMAMLNRTENPRGVAFEARNERSVGWVGNTLETGDFDRDGDLDVLKPGGTTLQCVLGDGAGGFSGVVDTATTPLANSGTVADFNGDGVLDIAVYGSDMLRIYAGDGAGGFTALGTQYSFPDGPDSVAAGDMDRDGDADLVVSLWEYDGGAGIDWLYVLLNDGGGAFTTACTLSDSGHCPTVAIVDLDRDGRLDVVGGYGPLYRFMGDGEGGLTASSGIPSGGMISDLAAGDLNGDGAVDFVTSDASLDCVRVVFGDGAGGLTLGATIAVGDLPGDVVLADLDNDGDLDVACAAEFGNSVDYALNDGTGAFGPAATLPVSPSASYCPTVAAGDLDRDGKADLVAGCSYSLMNWWLSDHTPPSGTMALDGGATWSRDLTVSVDSSVADAAELRTRDASGMWNAWQPYGAGVAHAMAAGDAASRTVQVQYRDAGGNVLALSDTIGLDTVAPQATDDTPAGWQPGPVIVTIAASDATSGVAEIRYSIESDEYVVAGATATVVFPIWKRSGGHGEFKFGYVVSDVAGNEWGPDPVLVQIDRIPPKTSDTADHEKPYLEDAVFELPATDEGSGVADTWVYWVNETDPRFYDGWFHPRGEPVTIPFNGGENTGLIRVWYFSVDLAGNVESMRTCTVIMGEFKPPELAATKVLTAAGLAPGYSRPSRARPADRPAGARREAARTMTRRPTRGST